MDGKWHVSNSLPNTLRIEYSYVLHDDGPCSFLVLLLPPKASHELCRVSPRGRANVPR